MRRKAMNDIYLTRMKNIINWKNVTRGLFQFVIDSNVCYEIHINICKEGEDILSAYSSLFLVRNFYSKDEVHFFVRKCLLENQPFCACIETAQKDYLKIR